jgi:hypothetical protein
LPQNAVGVGYADGGVLAIGVASSVYVDVGLGQISVGVGFLKAVSVGFFLKIFNFYFFEFFIFFE